MKTLVRIVSVVAVCAGLFGVSSIMAKRGVPAPPPPVLCGCLCSDGSIVIVHAPTADDCPAVCATACNLDM